MIIPSQHVVKVYELDDDTYRRLFDLAKLLSVRLERVTGRKAVAYTAFGTGLPHAHLHVVPHDNIDVLVNPTRYLNTLGPEELTAAAQQLKEHLGDLAGL
jgi:histidine triad (HIT) family protein